MIYDDQPQMLEAAEIHRAGQRLATVRGSVVAAFAAIDREALIRKAAGPIVAPGATWLGRQRIAERVLVAAGILSPDEEQPRS